MKTIKILIILPILLIGFFTTNASNTAINNEVKDKTYSIKGTISNLKIDQLILQEITPGGIVAIDTAIVDAKGQFTFTGTVTEATYTIVNLGPYRNVFLVIDAGTKIKADIDGGHTLTYTIKNSPASEDIAKIANLTSKYNQQILDLNAKSVDPAVPSEEKLKISTQVSNLMAESKVKSQEILKTLKTPLGKIFAIEMLQVEADLTTEEGILVAIGDNSSNKWYSLYKAKAQPRLRTAIGANAPDITLNTPEGEPLSLSSLKGKYVLIDFWASWCRPCRAENPNVVKMYNKYKDKGFDILSVSLDKSVSAWANAIASDGLTWNHISDLRGWQSSAAKLYSVGSIPQTILLDKEGKIIAKNLRGEQLEKKLASILQ